jgi:hypothetical protein
MTLVARPATPGLWPDTSTKLTLARAKSLIAECSPVGIVRYVPLPGNSDAQDIDADELQMLCELGLQVMLVQHVRASAPGSGGWDIRAHSGAVDGAYAAEHAVNCGYPDAHIYQDLEDVLGDAAATIAYSNAWAQRVVQSGLRAGLYHGFDVPLSAEQLYDLAHDSYATDIGKHPVAVRGNAWVQTAFDVVIGGVKADKGEIQLDLKGEVPFAAAAS